MPRLFLGNLGHDCRERDIERLFKGYGELRHVNIKGPYGFLEIDDKRDAEDAIRDLNGKSFNGGSRIRIEYANGNDRGGDRDRRGGWDRRGGGDRDRDMRGRRISDGKFKRTNYRLVVENLSSRTSWQDLKDFMRKAGDVTYTTVNRGVRGEGLVEFSDRDGMDYALKELDDTKLDGNYIRLKQEAQNSRSRSRSNRRGRSGSEKSRSRGRSKDRRRSSSNRRDDDRSRDRSYDRNNQRSRSDNRSRSRNSPRDNQSRSSVDKRMSRSPDNRNGRDSKQDDRSRSRSRSGDDRRDRYSRSRSPRNGNESE